MGDTTIEWTNKTWNPATGCTKVSAGCDHCYAETFAERFRGGPAFPNGFDVQLRKHKLTEPLRWRKPSKVFVNSMSDLLHDSIPDEYIAKVFAIMALADRHTFQVLTKRHARMRSLLGRRDFIDSVESACERFDCVDDWVYDAQMRVQAWPLPNVWLGVSTEGQRWADIRIPALLDTPAAVRFISAEPLLGPISLRHMDIDRGDMYQIDALTGRNTDMARPCDDVARLDWVIVGGESGHGARPMHPDWVRGLRDQCTDASVPFFFKQWGAWTSAAGRPIDGDMWVTGEGLQGPQPWHPGSQGAVAGRWSPHPDVLMRRVRKKTAGRELDGRTWDQYPDTVRRAPTQVSPRFSTAAESAL